MKAIPITKSETLKAKIGLSGPALNRIPGPAPAVPDHDMIRCIGQGSYGEVWLARNAVGTWRAVKVVYRQNFKEPRPYEREFAGIQSYEPISRSNDGLIDVLQIGRNDAEGYFYYVMELADPVDCSPGGKEEFGDSRNGKGETAEPEITKRKEFDPQTYEPKTLSREIQQRGRLRYEECLTLGLTLNLALGHLHRHGLIHRDVKPSNIIFVNGVPKLTDIGLVTDLAGAESFVGTEGFIPPEGPNSSQADLYALGKVLYEASMGKDRNEFPEPCTGLGMDTGSKALMELNAVLVRACAPDPKQRYKRAEEMNADLALLHNGESVRDKYAIQRRLRLMTRVGAVTVALILLGAIPYCLAIREARREAQLRIRAEQVAQLLKETLKGVEPSVALGRDTRMLRDILDQAAIRISQELTDQPEIEAEFRSTLGEVYQELGEYKSAEKMLRRALELREKMPGGDNLAVAQSLSDLSPALWNQGMLSEAETLQRRALAIRRKLLGESNLAVAESLQDLGCILCAETKLAEAEATFHQALEIRRRELGPENAEVAESLAGVANMVNAQGHWAAAEAMFRENLAMTRKFLDGRHPKTVAALNGLVLALLPQGKMAEAEEDAREALRIQKEIMSPDHPVVAVSLTGLARVLRRAGNLSEAKKDLREALEIWSKRPSNQNPGIAETLNALADILLFERNSPELEELFRKISAPEVIGERPNTGLLRACGTYYGRIARWQDAAGYFSKIVELEPANHEAYHALAALYLASAQLEAYHNLCNQIRAQFGSITNDPRIADRMAKDCLILPEPGADLTIESRLANVAVSFDEKAATNAWFQFCKGLAEYRVGHFQAARDWMQAVLTRVEEGSTRDVGAYAVLAMSEFRLQQTQEARQTMATANAFARRRLPDVNSGDLGDGWMDWVFAHALMDEATALFEGQPTVAKP